MSLTAEQLSAYENATMMGAPPGQAYVEAVHGPVVAQAQAPLAPVAAPMAAPVDPLAGRVYVGPNGQLAPVPASTPTDYANAPNAPAGPPMADAYGAFLADAAPPWLNDLLSAGQRDHPVRQQPAQQPVQQPAQQPVGQPIVLARTGWSSSPPQPAPATAPAGQPNLGAVLGAVLGPMIAALTGQPVQPQPVQQAPQYVQQQPLQQQPALAQMAIAAGSAAPSAEQVANAFNKGQLSRRDLHGHSRQADVVMDLHTAGRTWEHGFKG